LYPRSHKFPFFLLRKKPVFPGHRELVRKKMSGRIEKFPGHIDRFIQEFTGYNTPGKDRLVTVYLTSPDFNRDVSPQ
jgi:hypothetical protein